MASTFTQRRDSLQQYNEALSDSRCLQNLAGNLIGCLHQKHYEIQQMPKTEYDLYPIDCAALQDIESLILSLENVRKHINANIEDLRTDIDANIKVFNNVPVKTFFQVNVEQLTAIYQLRSLLPFLQPFLPNTPQGTWSNGDQFDIAGALVSKRINEEWKGVREAACFDREPRSLSVLPLLQQSEKEMKMASMALSTPWSDDPPISPQSSLSQL